WGRLPAAVASKDMARRPAVSGSPASSPAAPTAKPRLDRRFALGVLAAAVAAVLTHVRSFTAPFFADDWLFLDQVRCRWLVRALASPDPIGNSFRPLGRQVWFWTLSRLGGESAVIFHAANLLCVVAAVVLVALIARRVAGPFAGIVAASFL